MGSLKDALLGDEPYAPSYPQRPGWKAGGASRDAAQVVAGRAETLRGSVLNVVARAPAGLTADEAAEELRVSILSIRPRVSELRAMAQIEPTGERRKNKSGVLATVWRATRRP